MKISGLDVYLIFHAMKSHFSKEYDYFRFRGVLKNFDSATYREKLSGPERALYEKIGRKYPVQEDLEHFLLSNILRSGKKLVVADLARAEAATNYNDWIGRTQALSYTLSTDLTFLLHAAKGPTPAERFNSLFLNEEHQHPKILRALLRDAISVESFIILDSYINFFERLDQRLGQDVIWAKVRFRCDKYRPFLTRLMTDPISMRRKLTEALASVA
jgi:hypothetical protein